MFCSRVVFNEAAALLKRKLELRLVCKRFALVHRCGLLYGIVGVWWWWGGVAVGEEKCERSSVITVVIELIKAELRLDVMI